MQSRTAWTLATRTTVVGWSAVNVAMVLLLAEVHIPGTLLILFGAIYFSGLGALLYLVLRFLGVAK